MLRTSDFTPSELLTARASAGPYYPVARADISIVLETYGEPGPVLRFAVVPRAVTINRNSYKEADTWSLEFEAEALPFSPETIRSGAVEIRLFQAPSNFADLTPTLPTEEQTLLTSYEPSIIGLFDDYGIELSDAGRIVRISGTDYTALLTAKPWPQNKRIPTGQRLDLTIEKLVRDVSGTENMRVVVQVDGNVPVTGAASNPTSAKRIPVGDADNYWDVIYKIAITHGYIVFVRGLDVVIASPKVYIAGKTVHRNLVWGQNILRLNITRKLGKQRSPAIVLRSYDPIKRKIIEGRYPTSALTNKKTKSQNYEEVQTSFLREITSQEILQRAAEARYNLLSRSELELQIVTKNLTDGVGLDLLDLSSGDAVYVLFDGMSDHILETMPRGRIVSYLTEPPRSFPLKVAEDVADTVMRANTLNKPFRVKECTLDYSVSDGITVTLQLHNFVNVSLTENTQ